MRCGWLSAPRHLAHLPKVKEAGPYRRAVDRVMSLADFERARREPGHGGFHLQRMRLLLSAHGDPHRSVPTVHVAGTKGKGSVAAMAASVLTASGLRTGLYTSPHLHTVRERIRMGAEPISEDQFARLVERTWPTVAEVGRNGGYGGVTTFELMTLMAFVHFRDCEADAQVIEVGLGGRLDSTNLVEPKVSVITAISLDHTATLGGTVKAIAAEKAGIIKPRVPVVLAPQPEGSSDAPLVVRDIADRLGAPLLETEKEAIWTHISTSRCGERFRLRLDGDEMELSIPLVGRHQVSNAATALVALRAAGGLLAPAAGAAAKGLAAVRWPCRIEYIDTPQSSSVLVADGAHNDDSMDRLIESVPELGRGGAIVVFGALSGHSQEAMLGRLAAVSPRLIVVSSRHPRSAECAGISGLARSLGIIVVGEGPDVASGMERAVGMACAEDLVVATGSISVAAEAREWAMGLEPECYPSIRRPAPSAV